MFISFVSDSFSELEWTNGQCDEEAFPSPFLSLHYKDLTPHLPLTLLISYNMIKDEIRGVLEIIFLFSLDLHIHS